MIIDCDSHIMMRDAFEYMDDCFRSHAPRLAFDSDGRFSAVAFPNNPAYIPGATPLSSSDPSLGLDLLGNTDIDARLRDFERMGIDAHFALPQLTGWWSYLLPAPLGAAIAHSWNVALLSLMRTYERKIYGPALIPLQDVSAACRELEWSAEQGFRAILLDHVFPVASHPYGTTLASHPELWPFFACVEKLRMPVFLHAVQHGHRILNFAGFHPAGLYHCAPSDAELNLISLITSGLLDDFPGLQFIQTETGTAYIRPLAERMDTRVAGTLELVPSSLTQERHKRSFSEYLRDNFYWTIETEEPELPDAVRYLGADRFLFATDYPHHDAGGMMKFKDAQKLQENSFMSEEDKDKIRLLNAQRLFRLEGVTSSKNGRRAPLESLR